MGAYIHYEKDEILNNKTGSQYISEVPVEKGKPRKAKIRCGKCGQIYTAPIKKVKAGHLCSQCGYEKTASAKRKEYTPGQILNENTGSIFLKKAYRNASGELFAWIECGYCHNPYIASVRKVVNGSTCLNCKGSRISQNKIKYKEGDIITSIYNTKFKFIKETTDITISKYRKGIFGILDAQNNILETFPANLQSVITGKACGKTMSIGEANTYQALSSSNFKYIWQYTEDNLINPKTGMKLKIDFCIILKNTKIFIELDGEQHFKPVKRFGGEQAFQETQQLDNIKNNYAKRHNYLMIRIPYTEYSKINLEYLIVLLKEKGVTIG